MGAVSLLFSNLMRGKLGWYLPSPGKIVNSLKDLKKPHGARCSDHAWIKVKQLKPYHAHKEEMIKINKGKRFQQAVDPKGKDQTSSHNSADDKNRLNSSEERSRPNSGDKKCKHSLSEEKVKKIMGEGKKRVSSGSSERGSKSPLKRTQEQNPQNTLKWMMARLMAAFKWSRPEVTKQKPSLSVTRKLVPPPSGQLTAGLGIVSSLLKMGHTVTVWNCTEGACLGRTPAEVLSTCDTTFAHVLDPKAAKDLVLGPSDMLQGIHPGKCYVDMSTVDTDIVTELAQVIRGRFREASISGNQQLSNQGMLVILAAGDRGLYEDCSSCIQAMGKTSFFLGEVGNAAKMMLIINMVQGSFMGMITEVLTLAQVTDQSQQTLLDILSQGQLASILLDQKCQNILQGNFKPDFYLKYMQKDLCLVIALGIAVNHPTPMATAANKVYKRAKSDNMSAVSQAYIH
uniref:Glyoxylate reductase 1 homolog n=1 Tax=Colobus angolensis palliatus TaxID=336983 RepID=A0A2K5J9G7_COLAP